MIKIIFVIEGCKKIKINLNLFRSLNIKISSLKLFKPSFKILNVLRMNLREIEWTNSLVWLNIEMIVT